MKILEVLTRQRLTGNFGEDAAVKFLKKSGYKILRRNFVADKNEIDVIARHRDTVAFIEVKSRHVGTLGAFEARPAAAVTREKQRKIISCSAKFKPLMPRGCRMRFDIIEVYITEKNGRDTVQEIKHLLGAFDLNSAYAKH